MKSIDLRRGQEIAIEGKNYIIIECVEGTKFKVLAKEHLNYLFDKNNDDHYLNSSIARYLDNDYYSSLPESIRNAIVEISIEQKIVKAIKENKPVWLDKIRDAGIHKVFVPSYDEIVQVYGPYLRVFAPASWIWLRDACTGNACLIVSGGILLKGVPYEDWYHYVRPAFVIDLSKVSYTVDSWLK